MTYPLTDRNMFVDLFGRNGEQAARFDGKLFRIDFDITLKGSGLSEATIVLYNPNQDTIARAREQGSGISFFAGYGDVAPRIFIGDVTKAEVDRDTSDVILKLKVRDGARLWRYSRVTRAWTKTTALSAIRDVCRDVGVEVRVVATGFEDVPFDDGYSVQGPWRNIVTGLAETLGLEANIDNGTLVIGDVGQPVNPRAVVLKPDTGLIGRPDAVKRRVVRARSLLRPQIRPRGLFIIEEAGDDVTGTFRATEIKHSGSSWTNDYYTTITGTRVQTA